MRRALFIILFLFPIAHAADVTAFSSPENSFSAFDQFLQNTGDNIYIATYTFTSPYMARQLMQSGKNVTVIIEKGPVGGISTEEHKVLCALQHANITVLLTDAGRFMHAKYIISGDSVLVSTENMGNAGYPITGAGNRGWGAIIEDSAIADAFMDVFADDLRKSNLYECRLNDYGLYYQTSQYQPRLQTQQYENQSVYAFFSPNSLGDITTLIDRAEQEIDVEQLYIYRYWGNDKSPLIQALVRKAEQGVKVRVLLDGSYFNTDDDKESNIKTMDYLNSFPNIEAKLTPEIYEVTHAKAMIIDSSIALVSSINWNQNSVMNNREAAVAIEGSAAQYYQDVFDADWGGTPLREKETVTGYVFSQPSALLVAAAVIIILIIAIIIILAMRKR